ncbi:hypothetical protein GO986_16475 [Deinococcus sp. HMF7620]|uniref:Uncharacterized protein n=1 Tax=Deinococcus arboris TaxID=2682977 RepID=A0A7C9M3J9_9DEIO|nr:hypothetical protein [Deinococcus arboris]MVN88342.1 hypothetical protein [Deinococcus arboris]
MRELTPELALFWATELAKLTGAERATTLATLQQHYGPKVEARLKRARRAA